MRCAWIPCLAISLSLAVGCDFFGHRRYTLEMTPEGNSCRRVLTCWGEHSHDAKDRVPTMQPLDQEELDRIAKLYPNGAQESGPAKRIFAGRFKGALPSDVGGAGTYTRLATEMGDLFAYSERFRGCDDQAKVLADMWYAADRLTDVLILWFESELKEEPHWPKLRGFMESDLRQDIKNGALYLWMSRSAGERQAGEPFARAAQYFQERGYFQPQDMPLLVGAWHSSESTDLKPVSEFVRRFVASRMGLPPETPAPPSLGFLSSPERVQASWDKFQAESPAYKGWLEALDLKRLRWKPQGAAKTATDKPDLKESPLDILGSSLVIIDLLGNDHVDVTLACKVQPLYTNGAYDAAKGAIAWSEALQEPPSMPALCTAVWVAPDEGFQKARFGRTVLAGEDLAGYVLWRKLLSAADEKEWTAFLDALKPEGGLAERVKAFRFSSDPKPAAGAEWSLADEPRNLILKVLEPSEK